MIALYYQTRFSLQGTGSELVRPHGVGPSSPVENRNSPASRIARIGTLLLPSEMPVPISCGHTVIMKKVLHKISDGTRVMVNDHIDYIEPQKIGKVAEDLEHEQTAADERGLDWLLHTKRL